MMTAALPEMLRATPPLVLLGLAALLVALAGSLVRRYLPLTGRSLHTLGNLALLVVFALSVMRFARLDPAFDTLVPGFAMPVQQVTGGETHIPLSADGHYWIEAQVNGTPQRFMVDTGATISALSSDVADAAGVRPDHLRLPVTVRTANGTTQAQLAMVGDLRFGNVVARDLDVIVTSGMGGLNVLGMNFLSRLKSWRVEDGVLILVPRSDSV